MILFLTLSYHPVRTITDYVRRRRWRRTCKISTNGLWQEINQKHSLTSISFDQQITNRKALVIFLTDNLKIEKEKKILFNFLIHQVIGNRFRWLCLSMHFGRIIIIIFQMDSFTVR